MKAGKYVLTFIVLAVAAGLAFHFAGPGSPAAPGAAAGAGRHSGPPSGGGMPVEARAVETGALENTIEAVGSLASNESVILSPEIAGRIAQILFNEGQDVTAGSVLIKLDDSVYKAELAEAEATLTLTKTNYDRARALLARQTGTEKASDEALAALNTAQARVDLARAHLEKTVIAAPFDGTTGLRKVSVGDYVTPGQELVNLESLDPLKVDFRIAEIYLGAIELGQKIRVALDAFPGRDFEGEVYAIDPRIDAEGRSILLRARLQNTEKILRPGLFARVSLLINSNKETVIVREEALMPSANGQAVYRVVDGKAVMTPVTTGMRGNGKVEILSGLKSGDVVITAGQMKIGPDMPVTVMPPAVEPAAAEAKDGQTAQ